MTTQTPTTPALTLTMVPANRDRQESYGLLWESAETLDVTGRGVHNPSFPHVAQIWFDYLRTTQVGVRGTGEVYAALSARSIVIASTPVDRPAHLGRLTIGDVVALRFPGGDDQLYTVTAKPLDDPTLTPVTT